MPLIYIPFSQKDNLLGLHIYLRTRYSQSKVKVSHLNTILQFTTFIEWIEKENVEEADYANFSTKNILIRKTGRVRCGDGVPKYWNNSRKHLQYKPFCFLFSVSVRTIPNYHATVTHFHRGGNDLKKTLKVTFHFIYLYGRSGGAVG